MSHKTFAKLFETEKHGQVLIIRDRDGEGKPAVKTMFEVPQLGALATVMGAFPDTDAGEDAADAAFAKADQAWAESIVRKIKSTADNDNEDDDEFI